MSPEEFEFGLAPIYRILKKAGATRAGEDALIELAKTLDQIGVEIGRHAVELSTHAGRKTIKAEDIRLATKYVIKS
ncbi:MAG: histone family protein [Candidatus Bathyarchaeia archaeon]|jgi:histone H3/H4|nr:histone family protein [Candidatus Jordarchaeia archaeon]